MQTSWVGQSTTLVVKITTKRASFFKPVPNKPPGPAKKKQYMGRKLPAPIRWKGWVVFSTLGYNWEWSGRRRPPTAPALPPSFSLETSHEGKKQADQQQNQTLINLTCGKHFLSRLQFVGDPYSEPAMHGAFGHLAGRAEQVSSPLDLARWSLDL